MTIPADSRPADLRSADSPGTAPVPKDGPVPAGWPKANSVLVGWSEAVSVFDGQLDVEPAGSPAGRRGAPGRWLQAGGLLVIRFYQRFLSPLKPSCCRFHPTCSTYAAQALARHGVLVGFWLSLKRILRCNPFFAGGYDPVPPRKPKAGPIPRRP